MAEQTIYQKVHQIADKISKLQTMAKKLPGFADDINAMIDSTTEGLHSMTKHLTEMENQLSGVLAGVDLELLLKEVGSENNPERVAIFLHKHPRAAVEKRLDINVCYPWSIIALCEKHPELFKLVDKERMDKLLGINKKGRQRYFNTAIRDKWIALCYALKSDSKMVNL